jgi:hypothetical protein
MPPKPEQKGKSKKSRIAFAVLFIVALISLYQNFRFWNQLKGYNNPQVSTKDDVKKTLDQVGKLLVLPSDETPTIATVSDLSQLKSQPFFANAQVGDKVIIYSNNHKAILWRPSDNKLVEVAPLTVNSGQSNEVQNNQSQSATVNESSQTDTTSSTSIKKTTKKSN